MSYSYKNRVFQPYKDSKKSNKHVNEHILNINKQIIEECVQYLYCLYFSNHFRFIKIKRFKSLGKNYHSNPIMCKAYEISAHFTGIKKFSKKLVRPLVLAIFERENRKFIFEKKKLKKTSDKTIEKPKLRVDGMETVDSALFKVFFSC